MPTRSRRIWDSFPTHAASALSVGIMGLGVMGQDSAVRLRDLGFRVAGWSRSRKSIPGVECFAGPAEFDAFLARTDILVSLLPATAETDGIINRATIQQAVTQGAVWRADHHQCGARPPAGGRATFWHASMRASFMRRHLMCLRWSPCPPMIRCGPIRSVTVTPHIAADSDPEVICAYVAAQIERHQKRIAA